MSTQSMADVAFRTLDEAKTALSFRDLWNTVGQELGFSNQLMMKKMSQFYTNLSTDNRFTCLEGNRWDLKKRLKFEEVFVDTSAIEVDETEDEDEFRDEDDALNEEDKEESSKEEEY